MIFRFLLLSDEVDEFRREIQIDSEATFLDLHEAIAASTMFDPKEMTSFFICDYDWRKVNEITLIEMDRDFDEDSFIMEECTLRDYLEDEKQKLIYTFDYLSERSLFIELSEIITGKSLDKAICTRNEGVAPEQYIMLDSVVAPVVTTPGIIDTEFYGDESFSEDELDIDGFGELDSSVEPIDDVDLF